MVSKIEKSIASGDAGKAYRRLKIAAGEVCFPRRRHLGDAFLDSSFARADMIYKGQQGAARRAHCPDQVGTALPRAMTSDELESWKLLEAIHAQIVSCLHALPPCANRDMAESFLKEAMLWYRLAIVSKE